MEEVVGFGCVASFLVKEDGGVGPAEGLKEPEVMRISVDLCKQLPIERSVCFTSSLVSWLVELAGMNQWMMGLSFVSMEKILCFLSFSSYNSTLLSFHSLSLVSASASSILLLMALTKKGQKELAVLANGSTKIQRMSSEQAKKIILQGTVEVKWRAINLLGGKITTHQPFFREKEGEVVV